ncbi:MAG TPA: hypothetical protein VHY36_04390 [Steroidobacteraceae bacterium]|jgi:hypothetical protein|nr:hypothetical protein [Steroidobacteraceae bacterium]
MSVIRYIARISCVISLFALLAGCVVAPGPGYHEGYYDHSHHRWYHHHAWVACGGYNDPHCR